MTPPPVYRHVDWQEFDALHRRLADRFRDRPVDLVVGVAKGGLPLAVALCHTLGAGAFGALHLSQSASDSAGDLDTGTPLSYGGSVLPSGDFRRIALVDDVSAKGLVLGEGERLLRLAYGPRVDIVPVVAFADLTGIRGERFSDLPSRLVLDEDIDNDRTWIVFPWERPPAALAADLAGAPAAPNGKADRGPSC